MSLLRNTAIVVFLGSVLCLGGIGACSKEDKAAPAGDKQAVAAPAEAVSSPDPAKAETPAVKMEEVMTLPGAGSSPPAPGKASPAAAGVIIEVDGSQLTQAQLEAAIKKKVAELKINKTEAGAKEIRANLRKQILDEFVVRTLLRNEAARQQIAVSDKEVAETTDNLRKNLPPGVTLENIVKESGMTKEQMRQEIREGIQVNKLVLASLKGKGTATDSEILEFYRENKARFKVPESVRVRHILVKKTEGDDEKAKAEKRAKAEDLRKQLVSGADFAAVASKHSDCPSKESGGDLGVFTRGQMVKPFEDAAFSQQKDAIGPVVESEFGYHVIQVLERNNPKTLELDARLKAMISSFLEQKRREEAFAGLVARLRAKANIVVHGH